MSAGLKNKNKIQAPVVEAENKQKDVIAAQAPVIQVSMLAAQQPMPPPQQMNPQAPVYRHSHADISPVYEEEGSQQEGEGRDP